MLRLTSSTYKLYVTQSQHDITVVTQFFAHESIRNILTLEFQELAQFTPAEGVD